MPKSLLLAVLLGASVLAHAQSFTGTSESDASALDPTWSRVQALRPGTRLHVNGKPHMLCNFVTVDAESLHCAHGNPASNPPISIPKADITSIKLAHRGRSTLVGMGIGAGIGFGAGFAAGTNKGGFIFGPNAFRGAVAAIFAVLGAIIGAPIGYLTDFTAGSPIYKAP